MNFFYVLVFVMERKILEVELDKFQIFHYFNLHIVIGK